MAETDDTKTDDTSTDKEDVKKTGTEDDTSTDSGDDSDGDVSKWKSLSRKHERENATLRKRLEQLEESTSTESEKALRKVEKETEERVRAEMLSEMVGTSLRSLAKTKLADPSYVRLLDDDTRETFTSGGKVDEKAIEKALDGLVKAHPNLAPRGKAGALPGGDQQHKTAGFDINADIRRRAGRG